ncbi:MAG TPA: hypothetical protein VHS56_01935 [Candidatus Cybelea sp.]|jgi:hypothetical protein|nr:hypothetical protein [Candidatus Cybelea sp.]
MTRTLGLCAALLAAAIADPLVEFASNSGCFGPGNFTDRSNLDVGPVFALGIATLVFCMVRQARKLAARNSAPPPLTRFIPGIFAAQLLALFGMESTEQLLLHGHLLGLQIWLGAPAPFSLGVHAVVCVAVSAWMARSAMRLAETTLRVLRLFERTARLAIDVAAAATARPDTPRCLNDLAPILCRIGERAPPALQN